MTAIEHHTDCDSLDGSRNYHVGDCHQLAAVISRATGWDFAIFDGAGAPATALPPHGPDPKPTDRRHKTMARPPLPHLDGTTIHGWLATIGAVRVLAARWPELRVPWNWQSPCPVLTGRPAAGHEAA